MSLGSSIVLIKFLIYMNNISKCSDYSRIIMRSGQKFFHVDISFFIRKNEITRHHNPLQMFLNFIC